MKWRINNYTTNYENVNGKFDVNLYIPPATPPVITATNPDCYAHLFITLKLYFEKDDTGGGLSMTDERKEKYKSAAWPESEWSAFKNKVKELSTFWDLKFWLVLISEKKDSSNYRNVERFLAIYQDFQAHNVSGQKQQLVSPRTISCRFNLEMLDSPAGAHRQIKVAYLVEKSSGASVKGVDAMYISRSNDSYYDSGDIFTEKEGNNTIIHEIGHAIGLPHIGVVTNYAACLEHAKERGGSNDGSCYEGPLARDIMGHGSETNWQDSTPWRFALQEMTNVPMTDYIVQKFPFITVNGELITEGTSRWQDFYGRSWWSF